MTHDDLRFYSYLFVRRLPLMTAIGAIVSAAGLAYVMTLPPVYQATGTILVKSPEITASLTPTVETAGPLARLQVMQQEMLTYDALLDLAKRHNLYPATSEPLSSDTIVSDVRDHISLSPVMFGGNESALGFSVSFSAGKPEVAARVANDLIQTMLKRDLNDRSARATVAVSFFQDEVTRLSKDLAAIEARVQAYKTQHLQALPDTLEFRRLLQINLRDRLLVLEREQSSLQSRRASYLQYYRGTDPLAPGANLPPEERQLEELKQALASQRLQFSEDSLAIQSLKSQIAAAQAKIGSVPTDIPVITDTSTRDMQLAEMDARLDAITQERESLQRNDADLTTSIEATPANEAALSALEREYEDARTLYTAAAARLADASTGEQIESGLNGERLILMEAARAPEKPTGPKRLPMALAVAAAAIGAALGSALLLELLNRKVRRAADVEKALGIEVLASIPSIPVRPPLRFKLPSWPLHWIGTVRS
jgi:polysaccharide biosynthesis transport protein